MKLGKIHVLITAVAITALVAACGGGGDSAPEPVKVAASDLTLTTSAATGAAIMTAAVPPGTSATFNFPTGVPELGVTGDTKLVIQTGSGTSPTQTFSVTSAGGTYSGDLTYGSCIFTIKASTDPTHPVGTRITVNPCAVVVSTGGIRATGQATTVQILLQLGIVPSARNQALVSIDPATGVVTLNNTSTGASITLNVVTGT